MTCDKCGKPINYCFYINRELWLKVAGKVEGHTCAHCILEAPWRSRLVHHSCRTARTNAPKSGGERPQLISPTVGKQEKDK